MATPPVGVSVPESKRFTILIERLLTPLTVVSSETMSCTTVEEIGPLVHAALVSFRNDWDYLFPENSTMIVNFHSGTRHYDNSVELDNLLDNVLSYKALLEGGTLVGFNCGTPLNRRGTTQQPLMIGKILLS
jgi:hypothetical protein